MPVLAGLWPGVTVTVSSVTLPALTKLGEALPEPASPLHGFAGVADDRGLAGATKKSVRLLSVSRQPPDWRNTAFTLPVVPSAWLPSKQLAPP